MNDAALAAGVDQHRRGAGCESRWPTSLSSSIEYWSSITWRCDFTRVLASSTKSVPYERNGSRLARSRRTRPPGIRSWAARGPTAVPRAAAAAAAAHVGRAAPALRCSNDVFHGPAQHDRDPDGQPRGQPRREGRSQWLLLLGGCALVLLRPASRDRSESRREPLDLDQNRRRPFLGSVSAMFSMLMMRSSWPTP